MYRPIVVYGGTFDPVHLGHVGLVESILAHWSGLELSIVPVRIPPHRQKPIATNEQRLQMLRLAFANNSYVSIDDREMRRKGVSYTYLTVNELRELYPQRSLNLMLGDDAAAKLDEWREWETIVKQCNIIIVERPGHQHKELPSEIEKELEVVSNLQDLQNARAGKYFRFIGPRIDVSATEIRQALSLDDNTEQLIPTSVMNFITQQRIYMN